MPNNAHYSFISNEYSKHYADVLTFKEAEAEKNGGRKALYIKTKKLSSVEKKLKNTSFRGVPFSDNHLSVDAYYLADLSHEMPPEHYKARYLSATEEIVIYADYSLNEIEIASIRAKKFTLLNGERKTSESIVLSQSEDRDFRTHANVYTEQRCQLISDLCASLNEIQSTIKSIVEKISREMDVVLNAQDDEEFIQSQANAIRLVENLMKQLRLYNLYDNASKSSLYQYYEHFLRSLKEKLMPSLALSMEESVPLMEASTTLVSSISSQKHTRVSDQEAHKKILHLTNLMQSIKNDVESIKQIQDSADAPAEKVLRMQPIRQRLKEALCILFVDHTNKKSVDLKNFIEEQEKYINTFNSIEQYFEMCLEEENVEEVILLFSCLEEDIKIRYRDKVDRYFSKFLLFDEQDGTENTLKIADFFYEKFPYYFQFFKYALKIFSCYALESGELRSLLFQQFIFNKIISFQILLKLTLCDSRELAGTSCVNGTLNIAQSIILHYSSSRDIRFLKILSASGYFSLSPSSRPLEDICNHATRAQLPLPSDKTLLRFYSNPEVRQAFNELRLLSYFEFFAYLARHCNLTFDKEIVSFLAEISELNDLVIGLAQLLNSPLIQSRIFVTAKYTGVDFFENKESCECATQEKTPGHYGNGICLFFYAAQETKSTVMNIIQHTLPVIKRKFLLLSDVEQQAMVVNYINMGENMAVEQSQMSLRKAYNYILAAQMLHCSKEILTAKNYYLRLQLLRWRAKLINESAYMTAQHVLNGMQSNMRIATDEWSERDRRSCRALCSVIRQKAISLFSESKDLVCVFGNPHKIAENFSKESNELLLRKIAARGEPVGLLAFFASSAVKKLQVDVNSAGTESGKTALHQLVINAAKGNSSSASPSNYSECLAIILQHGARNSLSMQDKSGKIPKEYDKRGLLDVCDQPMKYIFS